MRGLTCGELASGSDEPAQRMARGDVGRAEQQQAPLGFPHPQLHMVGTVGASAWLIKTGTVAGSTNTRARITEVPRRRPESNVIDSSIDNRYRLFNSTTLTSILRDLNSGDPRWALGFRAVALASMLMGWPKRSEMERLAAEVPPIY